ncbi:MAG: hypothetical protein E7812_07895 [Phenylobacterium sp.]|nr:MAG: hypothetical protein E7812_07895 [Phenylobacterium sp.]
MRQVVQVTRAAGDVSTAAAARDAQAQTQIRYVTRTQIKETPTYVDAATDAAFGVPVGLVRVHDAAALGLDVSAVPDPAGRADGDASSVAASDLGRAIIANYGECRADQARLAELQDWLRKQVLVARTMDGAAGQD